MERRPGPHRFSRLEEAGFWLRDYGGALAAGAGSCALLGTLAYLLTTFWGGPGPETHEKAEILRFGYYETKYVHQPIVVVRTRDGAIRELPAPRQPLYHCRRGDKVTLVRRGTRLFVHREGCLPGA